MGNPKANIVIDKLARAKKDCPACPTWFDSTGTPCPVCGRPGDEDYTGKVPVAPWIWRKTCPFLHWGMPCEHPEPWAKYGMHESEALAELTQWDKTKAMSLWISRNNQLDADPAADDIRLGIFMAIADVLGVE